ncbi:MAG: DUF177 domain-containing protein [Clostridia bacterium]|nr:DUF177 domain-containing protein [Clostridia bacterium]
MLLDLKPLFAGSSDSLSVDFEMDLSEFEFLGVKPLRAPVAINGKIVSRAGIVESQLSCKVEYVGVCDRCLKETVKNYTAHINRVIVVSLENEDSEENDDIAVVPNMQLDLEDFCYPDIVMSLPTKLLCKGNCRGLCSVCGKNLNEGDCGCQVKEVDPRLAALAELLNN